MKRAAKNVLVCATALLMLVLFAACSAPKEQTEIEKRIDPLEVMNKLLGVNEEKAKEEAGFQKGDVYLEREVEYYGYPAVARLSVGDSKVRGVVYRLSEVKPAEISAVYEKILADMEVEYGDIYGQLYSRREKGQDSEFETVFEIVDIERDIEAEQISSRFEAKWTIQNGMTRDLVFDVVKETGREEYMIEVYLKSLR